MRRFERLKRRDWKDPFSWFNWFHQNKVDPPFLYRPESGRTGMAGFTNTRADSTTCATYRDSSGIWQTVAANVLRDAHYHYDGTSQYRTLLREGAGTNSALGACSFGDTTYWANISTFTLAAATSCIAGQTATLHTGPGVGSPRRRQSIGTFVNGQADCFSVIIEPLTNTTTSLYINDGTTGADLGGITITWATLAIVTAGTVTSSGVQNLGGGKYRLWVACTGTAAGTGAAGNDRRADIYVLGTGANTQTAILHHAQFEAASSFPSSPIVTVAGAVTRATDLISAPWTRNPEAGTWYVDAYNLNAANAATNFSLMSLGSGTSTPYFAMRFDGTVMDARVLHHNGSALVFKDTTATVAFGNQTEVRGILVGDGSVKVGLSVNAGAEEVAAASAANTLAAAWAGNNLYIGAFGTTQPANLAIRSILYVPGPETSLAVMRQIVRQ